MAAAESYLRVLLVEGADAIEVQQALSEIKGYIGSYVVEVQGLGETVFEPFDIAIGFNGPPEQVDAAVEAVRADQRVAEVRELRNRNQVTQLVLLPSEGRKQI